MAGGRRGTFSEELWAGWVLENYSLYMTILAAFTRNAANMPFKVLYSWYFCGRDGVKGGVREEGAYRPS